MLSKPQAYAPAAMIALGYEYARMMAEAQAVITMRMLGMGGFWGMGRGEESRMVMEKQQAFAQAGMAMWKLALTGARPEAILRAGIRPLGRKTAGNVKRLGRMGPRLPSR